jgi:hypothetical protein
MTDFLLVQAQAFIDRKYVARADERQKAMGLAYVEAERQDLAKEIASFTDAAVHAHVGGLQTMIDNAQQAASETQDSWKHRCYAIMAALGLDYGDVDWVMPDERKQIDNAMALLGDVPGKTLEERVKTAITWHLALQVELADRDKRIDMLRKAIRVGDGS